MILLGLILIVLAIGAGAVLIIAASPLHQTITLDAYGFSVGFKPLNLLLAGAGCMLLLWFGWSILLNSSRRRSRRRREAREADRLANEERLARERAAEERLAEQQRATEAARQRAELAERRATESDGTGFYEVQPDDTQVQHGAHRQDGAFSDQERSYPQQERSYPPQEQTFPQQHEQAYDPRRNPRREDGPSGY